MIEEQVRKIKDQEIVTRIRITVEHSGLLHYQVKPGDVLSKGDIIGEIKDLYGNIVETVRAPERGIVSFMIHNPKVDNGESILIFILK